jgi:phosphatidate cytidylyltransferase
MTQATRQRLFGIDSAFAHPATGVLLAAIGVMLLVGLITILLISRHLDAERRKELWQRYVGWLVFTPLVAGAILAGAFWAILVVAILSFLCYREYARATGLFREKVISFWVIVSILAVQFTVLDNWYLMFVALFPLAIGGIASLAILQDRPKGYIQRVALGTFAFVLFGSCLGHLGFLANDTDYRPRLIFVLAAVGLNDVGAFVTGRLIGGRKLCVNTSPNKTVAGAVGALILSILFVVLAGRVVFAGTDLAGWGRLILFGLALSVSCQFGDLMLSSIKRDLGLKDMDALIPGHGGLLDRFDSLILVAPVAFHVINYFAGVGVGQQICIFSGAR